MSRPSRMGYTGDPEYQPTAGERIKDTAVALRDDAAMAAAAARDYPVATTSLVLAAATAGLLVGYLLGVGQSRSGSEDHRPW